jgi:hypothetical protein
MSADREVRVRVRPQYARLYPELPADAWLAARDFAVVMVARATQARRHRIRRRTLDPRHFEFHGGRAH